MLYSIHLIGLVHFKRIDICCKMHVLHKRRVFLGAWIPCHTNTEDNHTSTISMLPLERNCIQFKKLYTCSKYIWFEKHNIILHYIINSKHGMSK